MHEGGELGYSLVHAFGAAFDNPDLIVACVVGDGEAETCPLEGSWKGIKFLNPARDGAVLPILHLNGYKISGPTVTARTSDEELVASLQRARLRAYFVEGDDPAIVHQLFAAALDRCYARHPRNSGGCADKTDAQSKSDLPAVADDRSAHAEGLDVPERSGWRARSRERSARTRCRSPTCARIPSI